jgi:hypothetical protein
MNLTRGWSLRATDTSGDTHSADLLYQEGVSRACRALLLYLHYATRMDASRELLRSGCLAPTWALLGRMISFLLLCSHNIGVMYGSPGGALSAFRDPRQDIGVEDYIDVCAVQPIVSAHRKWQVCASSLSIQARLLSMEPELCGASWSSQVPWI